MANELIINASLPETRIALMEDGQIQELLIERASGKGIVGNIYKGRVTRVLPGMQAAFVDIGLEKAAFLYVDDVYVHSEIWEDEEEGSNPAVRVLQEVQSVESSESTDSIDSTQKVTQEITAAPDASEIENAQVENRTENVQALNQDSSESTASDSADSHSKFSDQEQAFERQGVLDEDEDSDDSDSSGAPVSMSADPNDSGSDGNNGDQASSEQPSGTLAPDQSVSEKEGKGDQPEPKIVARREAVAEAGTSPEEGVSSEALASSEEEGEKDSRGKRHRRGRRGGKFRRKGSASAQASTEPQQQPEAYPESYHEQVADTGEMDSDRSEISNEQGEVSVAAQANEEVAGGRPEIIPRDQASDRRVPTIQSGERSEFRAQRSRDRRIRQKTVTKPTRNQVNIQDLLKEGQEVLVQVAKDPISTKGARLTCHISLPGRHLVCMPTIDHVGVSRRIEREDERRRLREFVERNRPRNLGFIVRTASGKQQSEKRIKQDIDYLTRLWNEIREKANNITAPALVYEDLNVVLRAVRDWVTEEIDKVMVDSRYHYNDVVRFVSHFMPPLKNKIELYHGDIPIFDAYGISTELSRALERKVWLKSGGYIVIDQAEALVAIDVNTGRYVGKKNLEDTILKTNLEAVQEIAYQLRLRNCGGIIILDLIDMEKEENKQRVYRALEEALMKDRARPSILKISELGLIEMTRKRTRDTIVRSLCESCTHCEGKGFIKSKQTVAYEVMREVERVGIEREVSKILVQAHPDVIDILAIDERESVDQLERRYRKLIYLQAVTDFHPEQFEVSADKKVRAEKSRDHHERSHSQDHHHERGRNRDRERDRNRDRERERDRHQKSEGTHTLVIPVVEPIANVSIKVEPQSEVKVIQPVSTDDDNRGNLITPVSHAQSSSASPSTQGDTQQDGFFEEEDRLAFLRAQAAQDAALARLNSGAASPGGHAPRVGEGQSRGGDRNHRRGNRGRRGGKFRRGNDRPRSGGGSKQFGYPQNANQKWNESGKEGVITPVQPNTSSDSSSDSSGGNDRSGGGGSDHSQPPV